MEINCKNRANMLTTLCSGFKNSFLSLWHSKGSFFPELYFLHLPRKNKNNFIDKWARGSSLWDTKLYWTNGEWIVSSGKRIEFNKNDVSLIIFSPSNSWPKKTKKQQQQKRLIPEPRTVWLLGGKKSPDPDANLDVRHQDQTDGTWASPRQFKSQRFCTHPQRHWVHLWRI